MNIDISLKFLIFTLNLITIKCLYMIFSHHTHENRFYFGDGRLWNEKLSIVQVYESRRKLLQVGGMGISEKIVWGAFFEGKF